MKSDPVFRDAAHHFLRSFDRTFALIEPNASDSDLAALSDTALLAALSAVPTIKTGRPVADKPAAQDKPAKKVRSTKR